MHPFQPSNSQGFCAAQIAAGFVAVPGNRAKCREKSGFFCEIAESLDLRVWVRKSILLQRGMTGLPLVMPLALPGRFLPELGRSFWSGLFSFGRTSMVRCVP